MSGPVYHVELQISQPPDVSKRQWAEGRRKGWEAAGERWRRHFLPLHFRPGARQRYGYRKRTDKHQAKKRRLARTGKVEDGGTQDLVFSGDLRAQVVAFSAIKAFPTRATITMKGPKYVTIRPKSGQPSIYLEITTTTPAERKKLAEIVQAATEQYFKTAPRQTQKVTVT